MESIVFPSSLLVGPAGVKFERSVFKNTVHYTHKLEEEETRKGKNSERSKMSQSVSINECGGDENHR